MGWKRVEMFRMMLCKRDQAALCDKDWMLNNDLAGADQRRFSFLIPIFDPS